MRNKGIDKIIYIMKSPGTLLSVLASRGLLNWMPDKCYLKIQYKYATGSKLNLEHPQKYNEKIQWLKIHDRKKVHTAMADKYLARQIVAKKIGEEYTIPCLGKWDRFEEIPFQELPNRFVLKCTHDSGGVVICKDFSNFDMEMAKKKLNKALKRNYYYVYREWPYKDIKPAIIAEEYIEDLGTNDLIDYKVLCFHGKAQIIEVLKNRHSQEGPLYQNFYDVNWKHLNLKQKKIAMSQELNEKPQLLDQMIKLSELLAEHEMHVRIDWYIIKNQLYFGEFTFYDGAGLEEFETLEQEIMVGDYLHCE